jgi:hypothetical protein
MRSRTGGFPVYHVISAEYAQNMLVCLPQDLHTFYVYWDFTELRNQVVQDFLGRLKPESRLMVRLCRFDPARQSFMTERTVILTQIAAGNYYFRNLSPVNTYCCEIGAQKPDGGFICFYQTAPLRMQPPIAICQPDSIALDPRNAAQNQKQAIQERLENEPPPIVVSSWS